MDEQIINKVAESGLLTINLEDYYPQEDIAVFDLRPLLFMEMILKEKDFRLALSQTNWDVYTEKLVAVTCSVDAVIPMWAYMLVASYLQPVASDVVLGNVEKIRTELFLQKLRKLDLSEYTDKRVVVKGCGDLPIGEPAYLEITKLLRPIAKSIMYGEPCSTVPVFKRK
ncbi:MAG: DUF2480 family protein [Chitinophagaceae bacterium]|nr:DUF2480 family protein [Chitinophagaceae bacterium]